MAMTYVLWAIETADITIDIMRKSELYLTLHIVFWRKCLEYATSKAKWFIESIFNYAILSSNTSDYTDSRLREIIWKWDLTDPLLSIFGCRSYNFGSYLLIYPWGRRKTQRRSCLTWYCRHSLIGRSIWLVESWWSPRDDTTICRIYIVGIVTDLIRGIVSKTIERDIVLLVTRVSFSIDQKISRKTRWLEGDIFRETIGGRLIFIIEIRAEYKWRGIIFFWRHVLNTQKCGTRFDTILSWKCIFRQRDPSLHERRLYCQWIEKSIRLDSETKRRRWYCEYESISILCLRTRKRQHKCTTRKHVCIVSKCSYRNDGETGHYYTRNGIHRKKWVYSAL